jgi:hypothetical protein
MWCCVGSGIENHSKYGEMIYAHRGDELFVNLFIPSTLNWKEKNLSLSQTNHFPDEDTTTITLDSDASFTLQLRQPAWVSGARLSININGKPFAYSAKPGGYIPISREWKAGDRVDIKLPMHPQLEQMPDGSDYYALLYGPVVLAAKTQPFADEKLDFFADDSRMGHIASGPMCSLEAAPLFVSDSHDFLDKLQRLPGSRLRFSAPKELRTKGDENLELIPFFRLHESRYTLYWPFTTPQQLAERQRKNSEADKARLTLEAKTIDKVAPGEQQPEKRPRRECTRGATGATPAAGLAIS